jgi:hypothetical protein
MLARDPPVTATAQIFAPAPLLRILAVLGGFTLLTAIFFWPVLARLQSVLVGPPEDNMQDFWNSWHAAMASGWRDFVFTTQIHFPEGTPLAYHSFAYPQVFAVAMLSKALGADFATLVALQNLTLLASFPLAAAGTFYLARHLLGEVEGRDIAAAVAGFIFAFNPWHVAQVMHHAHVATIQFLPLFVLFYLLALKRRSFRWLAGAAAMQALSALSCWYFFFYTVYFMAFHLLYLRVRDRKWPWGWNFTAPALCAAGAALLLSPWLVPMAVSGLNQTLYYVGSNMFVADLFAYVAFPPTHLLARFGSGVYARITGNAWEGTVYLGLANLAVLIGAFWMARKAPDDRRLLSYGLDGMIFFAAIASGEALHVNGHVVTMLHMPSIVLSKLPFFANVRTPARAMVFVYLFLGLALAQATVMAWRYRGATARSAMGVAAVLMLLDFAPAHIAVTPAACPAALATITRDPEQGFGVLDLPGGYGNGNAYMMLSACHGRAIVRGETSRQMHATLKDRLKTDNLVAQKRQLTAARVKYIVLHKPEGEMFNWNRTDGTWRDYPHVYRSRQDGPDMTVLQVY